MLNNSSRIGLTSFIVLSLLVGCDSSPSLDKLTANDWVCTYKNDAQNNSPVSSMTVKYNSDKTFVEDGSNFDGYEKTYQYKDGVLIETGAQVATSYTNTFKIEHFSNNTFQKTHLDDAGKPVTDKSGNPEFDTCMTQAVFEQTPGYKAAVAQDEKVQQQAVAAQQQAEQHRAKYSHHVNAGAIVCSDRVDLQKANAMVRAGATLNFPVNCLKLDNDQDVNLLGTPDGYSVLVRGDDWQGYVSADRISAN